MSRPIRPGLLPPGPVADLLTRRVSAGPAALRRLRVLRGPTAPSPGALARGRQRVDALLATGRTVRRSAANPERRAKLDRWDLRSARLADRLRTVLAGRRHRTPEQVLADLLAMARRRPAPSRGRASVIVRSPVAGATTVSLLGTGAAVRALTGLGLRVRPLRRDADGSHTYEVVLPVLARDLGNDIANVAWALRRLGSVTSAQPDRRTLRLFAGGVSSATVAPTQIAWHVGMVRADRAHALPPGHPLGASGGAGAVIAHPDTGWAPHPQYDQARIDTVHSYATAPDRSGATAARHTVVKGALNGFNLTHGTATGCLIVGGDGSGPDVASLTDAERAMKRLGHTPRTPNGRVVGIAPKATVVPIKFIPDDLIDLDGNITLNTGVLLVGDSDLVKAVRYALSIGADVMSLSVGGTVSDEVHRALTDAIQDEDLIVVAAAGQTYLGNVVSVLSPDDSVIEPARFSDVIAVAGCSTNGQPWDESHRGPNVDITAPADAIWVADFTGDGVNDGDPMRPVLHAASGTSFATAIVASAAAAWVAHWGGRKRLKEEHYEDTPLAWVFRELLQRTAGPVSGAAWDTKRFGPGVLNVERLLSMPLPPAREIPRPPATRSNLLTEVEVGLDLVDDLLDFIGDEALKAAAGIVVLAGLLASAADEVARELARGYAAAEAAAGAAASAFDDALKAGEQLLKESAEAAEDLAEAAAEQGEAVVDALVDAAAKAAEATGEAFDAVLSWF